MANRFGQLAQVPNFAGMLVDFDHFSLDVDKSSEAAGWLMELANRDGALWGKVRWSDLGEAAVTGGRFRHISPVFARDNAEELGNRRVRPVELLNAALTNDPNLKGMQPLSNRNGGREPHEQESAMKQELAKLLGLDPNAADSAFVDKIQGLKNRAGEADQAETKIEKLEKSQLEAQVEKDLEEHQDVIENREEVKKQLLANRDGTLATLRALKPRKEKGKELPNRQTGKIPDGQEQTGEAANRQAAAIRNRASQIRGEQGVTFSAAWTLAKAEIAGS